MLYYAFRELVTELEVSIGRLCSVATPSPDEWTQEAKTYLPKLRVAQDKIKAALEKLPEEAPEPKNVKFGPRVQQSDLKYVLGCVSDLATDEGLPKAIYSYNPPKLYRNGLVFIACSIELYWGVQKYDLGQHRAQPGQVGAFLPLPESSSLIVNLGALLAVQAGFSSGLLKGAKWDFGEDIEKF